jgi:hypothetical protein
MNGFNFWVYRNDVMTFILQQAGNTKSGTIRVVAQSNHGPCL